MLVRNTIYPTLRRFSSSASVLQRLRKLVGCAQQAPGTATTSREVIAYDRYNFIREKSKLLDWASNYLPIDAQVRLNHFFNDNQISPQLAKKLQQLNLNIDRASANNQSPCVIDELKLERIRLFEDRIKRHGAQRVDIFFNLLVTVWNKKIIITRPSGASLQIGKGNREMRISGCHPSPFTNLHFTRHRTFPSLFFWESPQPLLAGKALDINSNRTNLLPDEVNEQDRSYEGIYGRSQHVANGLAILNRCATGGIDPIQGLELYLEDLHHFYKNYHKRHLTNPGKTSYPQTMGEISKLMRTGTFSMCTTGTIKPRPGYYADKLDISSLRIMLGDAEKAIQKKQIEHHTTRAGAIRLPNRSKH